MPAVSHLLHVAIKTNHLDETIRFYCDALGFEQVERPKFKHEGAWLACGGLGPSIHLYKAGPHVGDGGPAPEGTSAIDHVSMQASGFHDYIARFKTLGLEWREFEVPNFPLWQLFVFDPNGVQIELTFDSRVEAGPAPDMSDARRYKAGEYFFRPLVAAH